MHRSRDVRLRRVSCRGGSERRASSGAQMTHDQSGRVNKTQMFR